MRASLALAIGVDDRVGGQVERDAARRLHRAADGRIREHRDLRALHHDLHQLFALLEHVDAHAAAREALARRDQAELRARRNRA
jgi:hypothetical protein